MDNLKITVIISTYNSEAWLEKVLLGYKCQSYKNFEVIIADDGSRSTTKELIDAYRKDYPVELIHLWHEDKGYRRQEILNIAITKSNYEYILMTDGDCIPRADFVEVHAKNAKKSSFLSGGYCKLSMKLSERIDQSDIETARCFDVSWLKSIDKLGFSQTLKLKSGPFLSSVLDFITPTNASFNNCNSSGWKADMIAINGYDERMKYGGPDRELGERLENYGVKGVQIRHQAVCLHLDHPRGYKTPESLKRNLEIREQVRKQKTIWTPFGIKKEEKVEA